MIFDRQHVFVRIQRLTFLIIYEELRKSLETLIAIVTIKKHYQFHYFGFMRDLQMTISKAVITHSFLQVSIVMRWQT
jgi:hypothetical protein